MWWALCVGAVVFSRSHDTSRSALEFLKWPLTGAYTVRVVRFEPLVLRLSDSSQTACVRRLWDDDPGWIEVLCPRHEGST